MERMEHFNEIRRRMQMRGVMMKDLAEQLEITVRTLYNKLQGRAEFTRREMLLIQRTLGGTLEDLFGYGEAE